MEGSNLKGRSAAVGFIFVTLLIDVIGFGIVIPVLPKLITQLTGETLSHASQIGGWLMFARIAMLRALNDGGAAR